MAFSNFGEQFAAKTLRRVYAEAVFPAITNTQYEGEIKKAGDRVNILSFPGDIPLEDYVAGTDMSLLAVTDLEDQLVVEKRKSYNFPIDRLEDLFTYVDDASDTLVENAAKTVERTIDTYVLEQAQFAKAGSWVGIDIRVAGSSRDTEASVATTATGGTITIQTAAASAVAGNNIAAIEHGDGTLDLAGFNAADVGKPIRLTSGTSWATEWYRITGVTDSVTATVENWDGAIAAPDIPNGDILRGLAGSALLVAPLAGLGKPTTEGGWGWELQAGRATSLTAANVFEVASLLKMRLDENEIGDTDRHLSVTPAISDLLRNASELQPAVAMAYENVVINGRVGRVLGFDIHEAAGSRVSTRVARPTAASLGSDTTLTTGATATQVLANHISYCTFAYKWAESRVVDAENQFAKKYQGLHLFGAKVPGIKRKAAALAFITI